MLEMICKELGVEIGEEWEDNLGNTLKLTKSGLMLKISPNYWEEVNGHDYRALLNGELKPVWRPKEGEVYYVPYVNYNFDGVLYNRWEWHSVSESSKWNDKLGIVFQTKEEAIAAANKMLEAIKEDK